MVAYLAERAAFNPEVYTRTVILEPFDPERSFGFNPLEQTSGTSPFLQAKEFAYILRQRWQEESFSPRMEELLCKSLYTLSVNNETLLHLPDLLTNKRMRDRLVGNVPDDQIKKYWTERFDNLSPRMQATFREPILSRIASFIDDPVMRDILGQQRSTFLFREAIRKKLWVIVNLSKGRLGENSTILGSMLFTKLELEIMALAQVAEKERTLFAVYADELQNLAGASFGRLIAEARKYQVAIVAGHQFWHQLDLALRRGMLAVGSRAFFRLHYRDAVELAGELSANERNRYIRLLTVLGKGEALVRLGTKFPVLLTVPAHRAAKPTPEELTRLKIESFSRYARLRRDIHAEIRHSVEAEERPGIFEDRGNQTLNNSAIQNYGNQDLR